MLAICTRYTLVSVEREREHAWLKSLWKVRSWIDRRDGETRFARRLTSAIPSSSDQPVDTRRYDRSASFFSSGSVTRPTSRLLPLTAMPFSSIGRLGYRLGLSNGEIQSRRTSYDLSARAAVSSISFYERYHGESVRKERFPSFIRVILPRSCNAARSLYFFRQFITRARFCIILTGINWWGPLCSPYGQLCSLYG